MDGMILSRLNNLDSEFVAVHGATKASVSRNEGGGHTSKRYDWRG